MDTSNIAAAATTTTTTTSSFQIAGCLGMQTSWIVRHYLLFQGEKHNVLAIVKIISKAFVLCCLIMCVTAAQQSQYTCRWRH
jgi:hypothetical protein